METDKGMFHKEVRMLILEGDSMKSTVVDILNSNSKCICCSYYGAQVVPGMWVDSDNGDIKDFKALLEDLENEIEDDAMYDFLIVYTNLNRDDEDFNSLIGYLEMYKYPVTQTIVTCKG